VLRLLIALAAVVLVGAAGVAAADVAGVSIPRLGVDTPVPTDKAPPLQRLVTVATTDASTAPSAAAPEPDSQPNPIPGQMLGSDAPVPVAPSLLQEKNGWLVSNGRTLVAVYAGAAGGDSSTGRVVIVRQNLVSGRQTVATLDAGPTGALTIATAPLGASVETTAQSGGIHLRAAGGRSFTLDLGTGRLGSG
jgi:sarcosine oxidase gamma subunit